MCECDFERRVSSVRRWFNWDECDYCVDWAFPWILLIRGQLFYCYSCREWVVIWTSSYNRHNRPEGTLRYEMSIKFRSLVVAPRIYYHSDDIEIEKHMGKRSSIGVKEEEETNRERESSLETQSAICSSCLADLRLLLTISLISMTIESRIYKHCIIVFISSQHSPIRG